MIKTTLPLVSVIIPVYNTEEFLEECINSVINQTYKNIETIIINDGSTDRSKEVLSSYSKKNLKFTIIDQPNSGNSVARNKGISNANGKYILFVDSDDFISRDLISDAVLLLEENNLDLIRFEAESFIDKNYSNDGVNCIQYDFSNFFSDKKLYNKDSFLNANLKGFWPSAVLYIVKKEILIKNQIFFKPNILHEDDLFTTRIFMSVEASMYTAKKYYKRRYRENSIMTSINSEKNKIKSFYSYLHILEELSGINQKELSNVESNFLNTRIKSLLKNVLNKDIDEKLKINKIKELINISLYIKYYEIFKYKIKKMIKGLKK
ncbi:glycosyltransferase [Rossellomorea marisflavi]|uniref:glycosyltransferase n=1 Tax=Rossellomorea marisflavi TaxID=189381 RepID=UPI002079873A|nr:glycosyltransferase [Rossellomorea marisflavi]USK91798.1 glycosyltransferase [Rossellomorea marisflavi]